MCDTPSDRKRKRNSKSSVSDSDIDIDSPLSDKISEVRRLKKERKLQRKAAKKALELELELEKSKSNLEKLTEEEPKQSSMDEIKAIRSELASIQTSLNLVLAKDDSYLENVIVKTFKKMKTEFLESISERIYKLETALFDKETQSEALKKQVNDLDIKLEEQKTENKTLKRQLEKSECKMAERFNDLEQHGRKNSIRIDGLSDVADETADASAEKVAETLNKHITGACFTKDHIDIAHRVGPVKKGKRQIIAKFVSRLHAAFVLRNKKCFFGKGIYVNEDLTRINQEALMSVKKKDPTHIKNAWTRGGKIKYETKEGDFHTLRYEDYQSWLDMPWPATPTPKAGTGAGGGSSSSAGAPTGASAMVTESHE